jgi:GT2 family glycosyltransferase
MDYSITFACYNQLNFTKSCIESLVRSEIDLGRVVVVDNHSTDQTLSYLETLPLGGVISNRANLGCGVAWNQGVLKFQSEWTIVMNNDVLVSPGAFEALIQTGESEGMRIVSPAMIEGVNDYDFFSYVNTLKNGTSQAVRPHMKHAVCMAIHNSVWSKVGYFRPEPSLLGYEDTLFFHQADRAGILSCVTGSSWIHHFGSITQKAMKEEQGLSIKQPLGYRWNNKLLNQSWFARKIHKAKRKALLRAYRSREIESFGRTLHGLRAAGEFKWI